MKSSARNRPVLPSPLTQRALKAFGFAITEKTFGVAVSGGSDSLTLLMLAADFCAASGATCLAVTVDHGLRPEAASEARQVRRACDQLGIVHSILKWRREDDGPVGQDAARQARHRLLAGWATRSGIGQIALGHTRDDRLETFLMRARQGSGWHGLAGLMPNGYSPVWPEGRGVALVRPLLAFGREELRDELRARGASWIDDPSNEAGKFERVRMRRLLERTDARTRAKTVKVMDRLTAMRAAVCREASGLLVSVAYNGERQTGEIPLTVRGQASGEAWHRLIEAMVMAAGGAARAPRRDALERLLARIAAADPDLTGGVTLGGAKVRLRKHAVLSFSRAPSRRGMDASGAPDWDRARTLLAPPDLRVLAV